MKLTPAQLIVQRAASKGLVTRSDGEYDWGVWRLDGRRAVTPTVERLVERGLLVVEPHPDKPQTSRAALTESGRAALCAESGDAA